MSSNLPQEDRPDQQNRQQPRVNKLAGVNTVTSILQHHVHSSIQNEVNNVENILIENINISLGMKDRRILRDTKGNLEKLMTITENEMTQLPPVSKMTKSTCLLNYNGPEGVSWHGTGFITTIPGHDGAAFMSTGNCLEHQGSLVTDFDNFSLMFNNQKGIMNTADLNEPGNENVVSISMADFIKYFDTTTIVLNYRGHRWIKKPNEAGIEEIHDNKELDYFVILLEDPQLKQKLENLQLDCLEAAPIKQLKQAGEAVFVFGYPVTVRCKCTPNTCSCPHPLMFSYGLPKKGKIKDHIKYYVTTTGGMGGSSVTLNQYKVIGIHVGRTDGKSKKAQSLIAVVKDLQTLNLLPSNLEEFTSSSVLYSEPLLPNSYIDPSGDSAGETIELLGEHSYLETLSKMKRICRDEDILSIINQEIAQIKDKRMHHFSQLVSAYFVYFYHTILIEKDVENQSYDWISENLVITMTNLFRDQVFLRVFKTPEVCLQNIKDLDTFCRDLVLCGKIDEKSLLGYVMGSQGAGKSSFTVSLQNKKATTSESVKDPDTGKSLENTKVLKIHENISLHKTNNYGIQIEESTEDERIRCAKVTKQNVKEKVPKNVFSNFRSTLSRTFFPAENRETNSLENSKIRLTVFDLGGHTEYSYVTTFFLSSESIFFLLIDGTKYSEENYYNVVGVYLEEILRKCPGATLMFFLNKMDKDAASTSEMLGKEQRFLECVKSHVTKGSSKFHPTIINQLFKISCKDESNFEEVISSINAVLEDEAISPARKEYPALWKTYQEHLEEKGREGYITEKSAKNIYESIVHQKRNDEVDSLDTQRFKQLRQLIKNVLEKQVNTEERNLDVQELNGEHDNIVDNQNDSDEQDSNVRHPILIENSLTVNDVLIEEESDDENDSDEEQVDPGAEQTENMRPAVENEEDQSVEESQEFETVITHLQKTGKIIRFPSDYLKTKIFIPQTLVNSFKILFRHDLRDCVYNVLQRWSNVEELIEYDFEQEADKMFESGHVSKWILKFLYKHRIDKHVLPLDDIEELIQCLGLGTELDSGYFFIPSVIDNDIKGFEKWRADIKKDSKFEQGDGTGMLEVQFYFDQGDLSIGVCEAILVGLERDASVILERSFRSKVEDRTIGTIFIACGIISKCNRRHEIFIREDEIPEGDEPFIRRRSVTLSIKPKEMVSAETCQQFFNVIEVTESTLNYIKTFGESKIAIYSCRILCPKCQDGPGYFEKKNLKTRCKRRKIHCFEDVHPQLDQFLKQIHQELRESLKPEIYSTFVKSIDEKVRLEKLISCSKSKSGLAIPKLLDILKSVGLLLIPGEQGLEFGTAFLAKIDGVSGLILFSAGHNYCGKQGFKSLDYSKYELLFNNLEGITTSALIPPTNPTPNPPIASSPPASDTNPTPNPSTPSTTFTPSPPTQSTNPTSSLSAPATNIASNPPTESTNPSTSSNIPPAPNRFNMKYLMDQFERCSVFMAYYDGEKKIQHKREDKIEIDQTPTPTISQPTNTKYEDYFALLLHDDANETAEAKLSKLGLTFIAEVGKGSSLKQDPNCPLSIFGHPFVEEDYKLAKTIPLRFSFGKERPENIRTSVGFGWKGYGQKARSQERIFYDFDTLGGNSGSPVLARQKIEPHYYVKGIHVASDDCNGVVTNEAQQLKNLVQLLKNAL